MKYWWEDRAIKLLKKSLRKPRQELNELDWKIDISEKGARVARHISAFANYSDGGFMIFGINDEGEKIGVTLQQVKDITSKIGNMVRDSVEPAVTAEPSVIKIDDHDLLFVYIPESEFKPVHLRNMTVHESYTRSAGQTRKLTKQEVSRLIANSSEDTFETNYASSALSAKKVLERLMFTEYFNLLGVQAPSSDEEILSILCEEKLVRKTGEKYRITNLGALAFAKNLALFPDLARKAVRVVQYEGKDRIARVRELVGQRGYAAGFRNMIRVINLSLPKKESIKGGIRKEVPIYPELAIRELTANALIHQDLSAIGTGPMIEIFADRIEIRDPGKPLVRTDRFLDNPPRSRNEKLAALMRRFGICEESGTGIDKIVYECEKAELPAPKFTETDDHLVATLFGPRPLTKMEKEDRVRACYLHACLKYVSHDFVTNSSIRERFKIPKRLYPLASRIIKESLDAGYIVPRSDTNKSRKHAQYVPFWAV